jgi:hypothetical protein
MNSPKKIVIIDLVTNSRTHPLFERIMYANFANIMPQAVGVWCKEEGHDVTLVCYTGFENLIEKLPSDVDIAIIGTFSVGAQLAYALSNRFRSEGAITVLGGSHARSYPEDAQRYFDYVLGFTDKAVIREVLSDCSQYRPVGTYISAKQQPTTLPSVRERWPFIKLVLQKAPLMKGVPMIGSTGCPYTCAFCIDATIPYRPFDFDVIKDDLRFLLGQFKRPIVGWHDPNFGARFDDYMGTIEEAIPPDSIRFIAESSLSFLSEDRLKRLKRNGFKAILPGVESWYDFSNKSKTSSMAGLEKVEKVSDQINTILEYIPYAHATFVFGLDIDQGAEPFELTKRFVDMTPGVYPGYNLLTAWGRDTPLNLDYQRANRVIPVPFHFLSNGIMNVRPKNYSWTELYKHMLDLFSHTFSWKAIANRYKAIREPIPRWLNTLRSTSARSVKIQRCTDMLQQLESDSKFRAFFEQETTELPQFYINQIRQDLGPLWDWLPEGALYYDPDAYLKSEQANDTEVIALEGVERG